MNLSRIDLNLLVIFDAVARTRSVTRAAGQLSLSQPAVSHALRRLREMMKDPLFVRGRDGLVLTPLAEESMASVAEILGTVGRLLTRPGFDPATATRRFRIAASDYALLTVVPGVMRRLRASAPRASIEFSHAGAESLMRLEEGGLDLAFWGSTPPASPFASAELFRERFVGLVCERHPLAIKAGQGALSLDDYLSYPHVVVTFRDPRQSPVDVALAALGRTRQVAMVSPNFAANVASLRGTDLIMSLPSRLAKATDRQGLTQFDPPLAVPDYPYSIVWHRRASSDPAAAWLRGIVVGGTGGANP